MTLSIDDLPYIIFERSHAELFPESLSDDARRLLTELDGIRNLGSVAGALGLTRDSAKKATAELWKNKLITAVKQRERKLDEAFIDFMKAELGVAVGPIAEVLIEDVAVEMGFDPDNIPVRKADALIRTLADEISDQDKKIAFLKAVLDALSSLSS